MPTPKPMLRAYKVLDRIEKRKGSHGLFADLGHKKTVNYIIKGVDKHGKIIGSDMDSKRGSTGLSFIKVSFI